MTQPELAHLELLAEVDTLVGRLNRWAADAPGWRPAEKCQALVRRLTDRATSLRVRLESPLVVAMLGGTGTGKSALVNALLGAEVVQAGRSRPTTMRPTLVCRSGLTPEMLGIDPATVEVIQTDLPALRDLVVVDCPDPDTTEEGEPIESAAPKVVGSNLARLRTILPNCDVLLVTATQQKYRSARVADELAAAARGAQLIFVQTHADLEDDVRDDWRRVLAEHYQPGHIFRIDSLRALADARAGLQPRGDFAALLDLLTRQMAGAAGNRIRRANFLDLTADTLDACRARIDESLPAVRSVQDAIDQQRGLLAAHLADEMRTGLLAGRRQWEHRLLGQTASRWGLSPFSLVLRAYQGIGGLVSGALLYRARTPAQMALWGAMEGVRTWRKTRENRPEQHIDRAAADGWNVAELRKAAIIVEGYVAEAGLNRDTAQWNTVVAEAETAAIGFVARVSSELESLVAQLAKRHTGWFTRWRYEILLLAMLGALLYRLGRNFFYDSWFAENPVPVFGLDFYLSAGFWLLLWCLLLLWSFCSRLRRGLRSQIDQLATGWQDASSAAGIFARVESDCHRVNQFRQELEAMRQAVEDLQRQVARTG
jgi:hypothetical protein